MTDKLKPCPFCGGEAEPRYLYCRPYIICSKCHAQIPCYNTYPKAIEAWNTRKPTDRIVEKLESERRFYNSASEHDQLIRHGVSIAIEIVKGVQNETSNN